MGTFKIMIDSIIVGYGLAGFNIAWQMSQYQKEGESSPGMTIVYPDVYKTGDPIYVD